MNLLGRGARQLRRLADEFTLDLLPGHTIGTPAHLFSRIDEKEAEQLRRRYAGTQAPAAAEPKKADKKGDKKGKKGPASQPAAPTAAAAAAAAPSS